MVCYGIFWSGQSLFLNSFFCFVFVFQTSKDTTDIGAIQKAADFVQAFLLGFEVEVSVLGGYLHHVFDRCMCHNILF